MVVGGCGFLFFSGKERRAGRCLDAVDRAGSGQVSSGHIFLCTRYKTHSPYYFLDAVVLCPFIVLTDGVLFAQGEICLTKGKGK